MSSGSIIPDRDILVLGAGGDKLLPDADIEASDLISVEWSHDVAKLGLNLLSLLLFIALQLHLSCDKLTVLCSDVDFVFLLIGCDCKDLSTLRGRLSIDTIWNLDPNMLSIFH